MPSIAVKHPLTLSFKAMNEPVYVLSWTAFNYEISELKWNNITKDQQSLATTGSRILRW